MAGPDRQTLLSGAFGSTSGLQEEHLRLIAERATPQPYATTTSPLHLAHSELHGVRRIAIFCSAGGIDVAHLRDLIAQGDPRAAIFADTDWELHDLATGYWPMLSQPGPLADLLGDIVGR